MTAAHCTHGGMAAGMYVKIGEHRLDQERSSIRSLDSYTVETGYKTKLLTKTITDESLLCSGILTGVFTSGFYCRDL